MGESDKLNIDNIIARLLEGTGLFLLLLLLPLLLTVLIIFLLSCKPSYS